MKGILSERDFSEYAHGCTHTFTRIIRRGYERAVFGIVCIALSNDICNSISNFCVKMYLFPERVTLLYSKTNLNPPATKTLQLSENCVYMPFSVFQKGGIASHFFRKILYLE